MYVLSMYIIYIRLLYSALKFPYSNVGSTNGTS